MKKNNILDYIYIIIILNMVPIALLGMFKIPKEIYSLLTGVAYILQTGILIFFFKYDFKNITKKNLIFIFINVISLFASLIYAIIQFPNISIKEIIYIISYTFNICFFIFLIPNCKIKKKDLINFIDKFLLIGLITSALNLILNFRDIFNLLNITNSYSVSFSSFFPNRNQFGIFMLINIILNRLKKDLDVNKDKRKYYLIQILFIINLILSMSRTSVLGLVTFYLYLFFSNKMWEKINIKNMDKKSKILFIIGFLIVVFLIMLTITHPRINSMINKVFIRKENITSVSGRRVVWNNGIKIFKTFNPIFGVGRFKSVELNNKMFGNKLVYFHSMYIEKLASNGIAGVTCLAYIIYLVFYNISKSKLDKSEKSNIEALVWAGLIVSLFETTTRFSVGYADTIFMIIFFTLPVLISKSSKKKSLLNE